ncbi:MAG: DUF1800 family protein [Chthoniobacteraceae bacterium]
MKWGVSNAQLNEQAPYTGWLSKDDDGDGITNGAEIAAGTNPFDPGSTVKITAMTDGGATVDLTFPTEIGKQYVIQGAPDLATAFASTGVTWLGDKVSNSKTLTVTKGSNKFFRVLVQDFDTDTDGASDWAENVAGYSPTNASDGGASVLNSAITSSDVVTVSVNKPSATQPLSGLAAVETGSITISRGGPLKFHSITVPLDKSGSSAVESADFDYVVSGAVTVPTSVTFPVNVGEVVLTINPKANSNRKTNVTATVKALAGPNYVLGGKTSGSVVINPAGVANGTGLTANYQNASSATYSTQQTIFSGASEMSRIDPVIDFGSTANTIVAGIALGSPSCVVTTTRDTALTTGDSVTIAGVSGGTFTPTINGTFVVTVIDSTHFSVPVACTSVTTLVVTSASITPANNANGWGSAATAGPRGLSPVATGNAFSVRWTGQILPKYSEVYNIDFRSDDSAKVWVNGQLLIDRWVGQGATDYTNTIALNAGVLYDIQIDYWNSSGTAEAKLYWWSPSQTKEIIPKSRLFPAPLQVDKPTTITSSLAAVGYEGTPFSFSLTSPNIGGTGTTYSMAPTSGPLPNGLILNSSTGVIGGTPTSSPQSRGTYNVAINATNVQASAIMGSSIVNITIYPVGAVTREILTANGPNVSDIVIPSPAVTPTHDTIPTIDDEVDYPAANTAERLRGYIVPPKTGNYYFWIAANNAAELWISNDAEYVNKVKRASVTGGALGAAGRKVWNASPATQQTAWLSLVAGQKYYFEVLHNTGALGDHHVAVGWCQDDIGTVPAAIGAPNAAGAATLIPNGGLLLQGYPLSGAVPSYICQPYDYPAVTPPSGKLYACNLGPQTSAITSASGSANLQVNAGETQAILRFNYQNLGSPKTAYHLHSDAFIGDDLVSHPQGDIIFDIDDADQNANEQTGDGGYIWNFAAVGNYSSAQLKEALHKGKVYLNIHSVVYPNGEIRGTFGLIDGSQTPPDASLYPEPATTDLASSPADAARFLNQATFGANPADVAAVASRGFAGWIDDQIALPPNLSSHTANDVVANITADINSPYPSRNFTDSWWKKAITGPDQLRQRLAFALSEIMVVSWNNDTGPLQNNGRVLADYYDQLVDYCLPTAGLQDSGNFRGILKQVTLTPAMGLYLDMRANQKGDDTIGRHPNENYGREIMQLFSVGIYRMWDDGRFVLGSDAGLVATYSQPNILGIAALLTGWNYAQPNQANGRAPTNFGPAADFLNPMVLVPSQHELASKLLLNNAVSPAATGRTPRVTVSSVSPTSPCAVTTATIHGLKVGDTVAIANVSGGTFSSPINGTQMVSAIIDAYSFRVGNINCTVAPTGYTNAIVTGATVTPAAISGTGGIAAITGSQADSSGTTIPHPYDQYGLTELDRAIDNLTNNDNVPPYICRQLIQRLVTSDPSPGYIYRVVQKWKNNGSGVRGDLAAVVKQILLDGEARRSSVTQNSTSFGKQREPIMRLTGPARAFPAVPYTGSYTQLTGINSNKLRITTSSVNDFSGGFTAALNFQGNYTTTVPPNPSNNPTSANYGISATLGIANTHTDIDSIGTGNPTTIHTVQPHGLSGPATVQVWFNGFSGTFSDTAINSGIKNATIIDANTFTVPINTTRAFQVTKIATSASGVACTVTAAGHNLPGPAGTVTGIILNGINGGVFSSTVNTTLNATYVDADTFTIATTGNVAISCSSPPTSFTMWREVSNPCRVTTQVPHGLTTGDSVTISGVSGGSFTPTINGTPFTISVVDPTSFMIPSSCAAASTPNTGNIQGGKTLDVPATGMVNVTYSQAPGSNVMTVNTTGPQTDIPIPGYIAGSNGGVSTLKSRVYLMMLTANSTASIASVSASTGNPATCTVTTSAPHGLTTGNSVAITGVGTFGAATPGINGTYTVTVVDSTHFTVPSNLVKPSISSISTGNPCTITTTDPHGLTTGNSVTIAGVSGGTFTPAINAAFTVTVTGPNTFTVASNCTAAPNTASFTAANLGALAANGVYDVQSTNGSTSFTVLTVDTPATGRSGNVIMPKISTSYTPVSSNNVVQYNCNVNHNMLTGDHIWVDVPVVGSPVTDAEYVISAPITGGGILPVDEDHFQTSYLPVSSAFGVYPKPSGSNNGITIYPLVAPPMGRSGSVSINQSTFNLGSTEGSLTQSPLNSPTVFNFFFPDYKFPGSLANNGMDSPEFQLTTDTNVMNLTNSITNTIIGTGGGNSNLNGLSSFNNGNSSVVLDIGSFMTPAKTSDAAIPALIDELANLLVGAPLQPATKTVIQNVVLGGRISAIGLSVSGGPCTVTTNTGLNLAVGATFTATISGVTGGTFAPTINGTFTATVTGTNTFTVPVNCTSIASLNVANAGFPISFPMTSPTPSNQQMRDRVRAIIHLILTSAEYAVQK